jgi:hypothetical protein
MSIDDEVLKGFKNPEQSGKEHRSAISEFLKDDAHSILAITSIQGSGKTTAIVDKFADCKDAILLTQSNDKIDELVRIINNRYPDLEYKAIYGLERACSTYRGDDGIKAEVSRLRKIGILTEHIHERICKDDECGFITLDKKMNGRIIESVPRFVAQITMGKQFREMHWNRLILIDEADGLLNQRATSITVMPYDHSRLPIDAEYAQYLPEIQRIKAPDKTVTELMDVYNELIKDIDANEYKIRTITDLIRLLSHGFYSVENKIISELPPLFFIFKKVLESRLKLVIGTATMRNHRINFRRMETYYQISFELEMENLIEKWSKAENAEDHKRYLEQSDFLNKLDGTEEFNADYIPGFQMVFALQSNRHSYSYTHYRKAFAGKDGRVNEELRKETWNELRAEIIQAVRFYEMQSGKETKKILVITFKTVMDEINRYQNKLRKMRHGSRDPLFMKMEALPFFSNRMHGINANLDGYDLILTIGDPLDPVTAKFATDTEVVELKNKRGFRIMENIDEKLKKEIYSTMLSELLEAFHRGRSEIPIVALSNFLTPAQKPDSDIVRKILEADNFTLINVFVKLWHIKHEKRTPQMEVFLENLYEEIGFEFK